MSTIISPLSAQDLFTASSVQEHPLGQRGETNDGRVFRYCKAGTTALVAGKTQQNIVEVAAYNLLACANAAVGATELTVTMGATALTANQLAEGFVFVDGGTGAGQMFKIKSHPAIAITTAGVITLEDPVVSTMTSVTVCLKPNPYDGVIIAPSTPTGAVVGVAIYPITASYYGWIQVEGICPVLSDSGTWSVGDMVGMSNATDGAAELAVLNQGFIGNALATGASAKYRPVLLKI